MADFTSHEAPAHKAQALPVTLPTKLVGRDTTLAQVYSQLKNNKPVLLFGAAGIGKTALAATLASAYTELPGGALWFNVDDSSLSDLIVGVGRAYNVPEITGSQNPLGMVGAAASTLKAHKPLLVLDGLHNAEATANFVARCADGLPVMIVSKDPLEGSWGALQVSALDEAAAVTMLKLLAGLDGQSDVDDDLDELASILGYSPYAISLAAGTMRAAKQTPADYLTAFEKIPSSAGATPPLLALTIGFRGLNSALQGIMLMIGGTFGAGASGELLSLMSGAPPETVEQVMTMLAAGHFVERTHRYDAPYYRLHDITDAFTNTWLKSQGRLEMVQGKVRDAVLDYTKKYSADSPDAHDKLACAMDLIMAVSRWCAEQGERDAVNQIVVNLMQAGDFVNARGYVHELLALRGMASSFTTAFPAYPTPPAPEDAIEEMETIGGEAFDDDDEFEDEDDFEDEEDLDDEFEDSDEIEVEDTGAMAASLLDLDAEDSSEVPTMSGVKTEDMHGLYLGDFQKLQAALRQAKADEDMEQQVDLLRQIGDLQAKGKMETEAIASFSEALAVYEELDDQEGILDTLDTLSALMVKTENSSAAVLHAARGISLAEELGEVETRMHLLVTLGDARQQLGESDQAVKSYEQALEVARNEDDEQNEAMILYKLGYAQLDNNAPDTAAETWEQALKLFRAQGRRDYEGRVLGGLGTAYVELGRWTEAINFHTSALYIAREVKDKDVEALELGNLGYAAVQANQLGEAVLRYRQALHLSYETNNRENIVSNIVDLVRLLSESPRHLDLADLLINDAIKLEPTDREVLKLKEKVTSAKMQAYAEDVKMLPVHGTAQVYAANAYKLLDS